MTLTEFVRENRIAIDMAIEKNYSRLSVPSNDRERREWVENDEGLYLYAKSVGVEFAE